MRAPSKKVRLGYSILLFVQHLGALACFVCACYLFVTGEAEKGVSVLTLAFVAGIAADVTEMKRKHEWGDYK